MLLTNEEYPTTKKRYKLAPPDGGYGYAIAAAAAVNLITAVMFVLCFGMIYHDFLIKLNMGSTSVGVLTGIKTVFLALSGFLIGPLEKMMNKRMLALLGCVIYNAGGFGIVFVNTQIPFFICHGILQSIGTGFLINTSYSIVTEYFVKRRMLFMALIHVISCGASMVAPILVTYSMAEYGYQGTLIIMTAVGVQSFVACALIQPVAWHMRRVRIKDDIPEKKLLLQRKITVETVADILPQTDIKPTNDEYAERGLYTESITGPGIPITAPYSVGAVGCNVVMRYVDWPLIRRFVLTGPGLGMPTVLFADVTYMYSLPPAMYAMGLDKHQVKWAFALLGIGDITCRLVITLFSGLLKKIGSHWLYFCGLILSIATRLALLWVRDYTIILAIFTAIGISRSMTVVLMPLVIVDYSGPDKFPSAIGITFMMIGLISIVLGPAIGAIADAAQSYTVMFGILIGLLVTVAIAWVFEIWWNNRRLRLQETTQK